MTKEYKHTQIGYLIITVLAISIFFTSGLMAIYGLNWVAFVVLVILGTSLGLFSALTVIIEGDVLEIRFGLGLIRKRFFLKDIESCKVVKNKWYYGWEIRLTPHGWLYNVSGLDAVEIKMKTGKKCRIGTDTPNELENAILQIIRGKGDNV